MPATAPASPPGPAGEPAPASRSGQMPARSGGPGWLGRLRLPHSGSGWWLAAAAAAFSLAQVLAVSPHTGLSWDETVYVSQVSGHAPAAYFDAARARGVPLLVAPVTLLTSSVAALRVYLALASGLALAGALWTWRRSRPAWLLALAAVAFGGLWVALYYGPQAMPDEWVALSSLAAAGFFTRAVRADGTAASAAGGRWRALAGLAGCLAAAALFRPGDAAYLAAALMLAVLLVPGWRRWDVLGCVIGGTAAGAAEWVAEAYLRFGSPLHRLHLASAEQGGLGFHLAIWDQLRALNGPTLCRPCTIGWRYPELSLWWLALPVIVAAGLLAARRAGRLRSSALAAACGLALAAQYLFGIGYAAPRFLLPAYALLAIPVADCLGWLVREARPSVRQAAAPAVVAVLLIHLLVQQVVLAHEAAGTVTFHRDYQRIAAELGRLGVRPPCLIQGEQFIPIAYLAGCASAGQAAAARAAGQPVAVLEYRWQRPPGYARHWRRHRLPGTRILKLVAYLPPARR